jgi:hypothetical protein
MISIEQRRRGSTVQHALYTLDELGDVVQRKTWLEIAKIAGRYLEGLPSGGDARADQPPAQCFVDNLAEGTIGAARLRPELGCHIVI